MSWTCPKCSYPNPDHLPECFQCNEPLEAQVAAEVAPDAPAASTESDRKAVTPLQMGIFFAVIIALGCIVAMVLPDTKNQKFDDLNNVYWMSTVFVKRQLKAPSTADFPALSDTNHPRPLISKTGEHSYSVTSYVDAQNAFGAKLRKAYTCKLTYVGNDEWRCDEVRIDE